MNVIYPAILHKEDGAYWVDFPDLPGCQSFGSTLAETVENAKEALVGHCLVMIEQKMKLPVPSEIDGIDTEGGTIAVIEANLTGRKVKYIYPAVLTFEEGYEIAVTFPDLPGCATSGRDEADAIAMGREAMALHLWSMEVDGDAIPTASSVKNIELDDNEAVVFIEAYMPAVRKKKTKYVYPAIFTKEGDFYLVRFPDLDGCYTQGESLEDAMEMAEDVLCLTLYHLEENEGDIPTASAISALTVSEGEFTSLIRCDTVEYRRFYDSKAVKKTLTIPSWLNTMSEREGINFSAVLQSALKRELNI